MAWDDGALVENTEDWERLLVEDVMEDGIELAGDAYDTGDNAICGG